MSDILEQINSLTEQFSNLFERKDLQSAKKAWSNANDKVIKMGKEWENKSAFDKGFNQKFNKAFKKLHKSKAEVERLTPKMTKSGFDSIFKDSPKLYKLTDIERARKAQEYRAKHSEYDPEEGMIYHEPPEEEKKPIHNEKPKVRLPKGEDRMNDNNSYNEVVSQINSLTEQFSSLFEIEGLGEPSGDVPPSTNKIKKSRKTKDGKVELVSVEDELFPEEGNAREQFRQKIINTINGMIQGTATLEDLMQVVRAKQVKPVKEGFEGAIEILEEIINEVSDDLAKRASKESHDRYNRVRTAHDSTKELIKRNKQSNFFSDEEIKELKDKLKQQKEELKKAGRVSVRDNHNQLNRDIRLGKIPEGFEGAIELLEEIINEVSVGALARAAENNFNKRRDVAKDSTEKSKKARDSYEKQSKEHPEDEPALYNALSKLSRIAHNDREKASHANDLVNLNLPKDSKVSANKLFDKADKTYAKRGKEVDKALEKGKGRGDKEFDAPMKKFSRAVDLAVADPVVSRRTNGGANESFEQAINILETVLDAIKKSDKSNEKKSELKSKLINARDKERELANKKAWDSWVKGERKSNTTDVARTETKNTKGERKTRLRSPNNNYRSGGFSKTKPEWKQVEDSLKRHEKKVANESFEQAMGILEEIINEVSIGKLSRALDNSVEKRQKEAQKAKEKAENAPKGSNTAMLNAQAQKAIRRSQDAQVLKRLRLPKDSKVSANKLFKSAEKVLPHRENDTIKNSNSSTYSRYRRAWDIADTNPVKTHESFEQAIDIIEELMQGLGESKSQAEINSIAAKVLPQREANAKKAHDELNNVTGRISPYSMLNGKLSRKQRETVANALNKAEQAEKKVAHAKNLINNKPKEKEPSGIKFNNVFCSCENPFKEAIDILELFDRPDLVDDVLKVLTKKTMKQHLEAGAKKLLGLNKPKKPANEDFDSSNIKEYNMDKTLKLLEAIINEVSDKKYKEKLDELEDGIKRAEEFKEVTKDKLDDVIIPQEHRLNVSQNKYEDRIVKREREKYEKGKAKKGENKGK